MSQLTFKNDEFLSKADIKAGHVYIKKEGILLLYIGKDSFDRFIFYNLASVLTEGVEQYSRYMSLAHYNLQVQSLISLCEAVMHQKCDIKQTLALKGLPKLYAEFPFVDYVKELPLWYTKSKVISSDLPVVTFGTEPTQMDIAFVRAKDLVPGELYYSGSLWRSLYLYLGRDSGGDFCWYFVGNEDILMQNNLREYAMNTIRTRANKKVRRLIDAPRDPNAYLYGEAQKLIQLGWKADLTGLNLG